MTTSSPTVRAVYEDWLLERGRALGSPRVGGYGGYGYGGGIGHDHGYGDGLSREDGSGNSTIWRRRD